MGSAYYTNRDDKNLEKIRALCAELPPVVTEFFVGIQMRTSSLTRLNYAYDLRIFFDFLTKRKLKGIRIDEIVLADLKQVTASDIEQFLDYLSSYTFQGRRYRCGEKAKMRKLSTIRAFFKYFFNKEKLPSNVAAKVEMPKRHEDAIIRLEPNEVAELLNTAEYGGQLTQKQADFHKKSQKRDVAILTLFLGTGIRISELVGLDRSDIDFDNRAFTVVRKGGNKSILYFSDEVAAALKDYLDWLDNELSYNTQFAAKVTDRTPLFFSAQGKRISVRAVELLVKKYSRIVCPLKKVTPHKLRSTYGTALYRETQDIYVVADVLGHKDINTTKKHYAAISEDIRKSAARKVRLRDDD